MSDWKRATRELSFEQLPAEMKDGINQYLDLYNLGDILSDVLMCIQTNSDQPKKGLFGSAEWVQQCAIVTPRWLVWVVRGTKTAEPAALSVLLTDVVIQDYADTEFAKMVPDSGIQVTGRFNDVSENASAFIGLEENAVGKKFKQTVIAAVQDAKK